MPPSTEPVADLALNTPVADTSVGDSATLFFGIALGAIVMIVLALNALAY